MRTGRTGGIEIFRALLLCFGLLIVGAGYGQDNFLPGYILKQKGDTVRGYIDYRNWDRNPDVIWFREAPDGPKSAYTPLTVKTFGVADETYEGAIVETETSPVDVADLGYEKALNIVRDTTFLQVIVKGAKNLYYVKTRMGRDQYYIRQDSAIKLLIYKKYLKDQDGQTGIAENKTFLGQLSFYLSDCPEIQKKINATVYKKSSLEDLFLSYYKCTGTAIGFHKKTEKTVVEFGVLAGASLTILKFGGTNSYNLSTDYSPSVNFTGGVFMDVIIPRSRGRWSVCNELIYSGYKVTGQHDDYVNANKYTIVYTTFGYGYLKMNNMVRYRFPVGKLFLYGNVGVSNGIALYETNYFRKEYTFYGQTTVTEGKALERTRKYEIGANIGAGARYKKFSFEMRYEWGNGMSMYIGLLSRTHRFYTFLTYRF